ncbi:MAG: hypothetical protein WBM00_01885 [Solirubrobacterales bacterium]
MPDQNGDLVKLSDLRGQTVVLYFYPRADTVSSRHGGVGDDRRGTRARPNHGQAVQRVGAAPQRRGCDKATS